MLASGRIVRVLAIAAAALAVGAAPAAASTVYTSTNSSAGNAVQTFDRAPDGSLTLGASFATGGTGTGGGLGNQGAVVLDGARERLFVVNAGSDQITSFGVARRGLQLRDLEASNGDRPVSLTVHGDLLYVLNAGSDEISGFRIRGSGDLRPSAARPAP